jgi:hypothetical protein
MDKGGVVPVRSTIKINKLQNLSPALSIAVFFR